MGRFHYRHFSALVGGNACILKYALRESLTCVGLCVFRWCIRCTLTWASRWRRTAATTTRAVGRKRKNRFLRNYSTTPGEVLVCTTPYSGGRYEAFGVWLRESRSTRAYSKPYSLLPNCSEFFLNNPFCGDGLRLPDFDCSFKIRKNSKEQFERNIVHFVANFFKVRFLIF